jgi:hypothetical protein
VSGSEQAERRSGAKQVAHVPETACFAIEAGLASHMLTLFLSRGCHRSFATGFWQLITNH